MAFTFTSTGVLLIGYVAYLASVTSSQGSRLLYRRPNGWNRNGVNIAYVRATFVRVGFNYVNGAKRFEVSARELVKGKYVGQVACNVSLLEHARSATLDNLQPGHEYIVYVQAYGKSGKVGSREQKVVRTCQKCYVCNDKRSNKYCQRPRMVRECPQGMDACLNEVRYSKGLPKISKRCAQWRPELGKRVQNGRDTVGDCLRKKNVKDATCKCMCRGNLCNREELPCMGDIASWSKWTQWANCSASCWVSGEETRSRICQKSAKCQRRPGLPECEIETCQGHAKESRTCEKMACAAVWTLWSEWSECGQTCGGDVSKRTRQCHNGKCLGEDSTARVCNLFPCPVWATWQQWSECSVSCGDGIKTKTRSCVGGNVGDAGCRGPTSLQEVCNEQGNITSRACVVSGDQITSSGQLPKTPQAATSNDIIRLVGPHPSSGRVEILYNGAWGTICDDYWDIQDAHVVCRMLGFRNAIAAVPQAYFGQGTGSILLNRLACSGNETSILDCGHQGLGVHSCSHREDASATCQSADTTQLGVRLSGGDNSSGRVEINYKGVWGTICDDQWDIEDATVICRMLGFANAIAAHGWATFGQGTGDIMLDNVNCVGLESSISECEHGGWFVNDCSHDEDASVECQL